MEFCPIASGSSGNALYAGYGDTRVLIDAGISCARIEAGLREIGADPRGLSAILITHEHHDHVAGAGALSRRYGLPVYATRAAWLAAGGRIGAIPVKNMREFEPGQSFFIGRMEIAPFRTPHDAADPVGFAIYAGRRKLCVATDIGCAQKGWMAEAAGADILLIESNHDLDMLREGPYPPALKRRILGKRGHLSNVAAGEAVAALCAGGVRRVILGHLSGENNAPRLAYEAVARALAAAGFGDGDVALSVAHRDRRSELCVAE